MNTRPWFKHDQDAHLDLMLRDLVRKHGHCAHSIYWTILEMLHKHGNHNTLLINSRDLEQSCMVKFKTLKSVLEDLVASGKFRCLFPEHSQKQLASFPEVTGKQVATLSLGSGNVLGIEVIKFREKQENMGRKAVPNPSSKPRQNLPKLEVEVEVEKELKKRPPTPSASPRVKGVFSHAHTSKAFQSFWQAYPHKVAPAAAWQSWKKFDLDNLIDEILYAVEAQKRTEWRGRELSKIPHPTTWLNQNRWQNETGAPAHEHVQEGLAVAEKWRQKTGGSR